MCESNNNQQPVLIEISTPEDLERLIQEYMPKISKVDIKEKNTPEELVEAFRRGFGLEKHNYLKNDLGILCYDLMICRNPLEKEKKQLFYTFFSLEDVYDPKVKLAKIYEYYLKHYDKLHIDTMLQICYSSANEVVKKEDQNRFDIYTRIQDGFYLKFDKFDKSGDRCELYSLTDEKQPLSAFILDKNRLSSCQEFIPEKSDITEDSIKHCIGNLEDFIKEKVSEKSDEETGYIDCASAFLGIKTTNANPLVKGITEKQVFENVYRISLINELAVPGLHYLYFIPLSFPNHSQIGHFVLSSSEIIERKYIEKFRMLSFVLMFPLSQVNMSTFYIQKAKAEAIKSAKAAIMSRNLSHNLGSHVMSYLKQNFNSAQDMMANGSLKDVVLPDTEKTKEIPLLVGMGKFISYLQERQDYIATVSTDYIPYPSVVNFKDAIYDELNPDYRFQRHTEWRGHKPANILLQNIAKSEGLSREVIKDGALEVQKENNILIKYGQFDGLNKDKANTDYDKLRQWNFSLPGGSMGRQAIFSIVENVIRNAAKHGTRKSGESLIVRFDIIDPFVDTEKMESDFSEYKGKVDDLYIVTLTDNVITGETDRKTINEVINKSFYNEGTDLTSSNKGIKEMIISAAWLRGIRIEEHDRGEEIAPPIIEARISKDGYLQYVFCIPKVKEVAIITTDKSDWLNKQSDEVWIKKGWYVFTLEEYKKQSKNFNFVILDQALQSQKEEIRKISSNRFFIKTEEKTNLKDRKIHFVRGLDKLKSEQDLREAEEELFKELADIDDGLKITIYDKKDEEGNACVEAFDSEESIADKRYVYRKHNDTDLEFVNFLNSIRRNGNLMDALNKVEFIEGITGGNSTDRLLRHNDRNLLWAYQHAHAMKTKVAIFDERIFTRITGFDMSQLKEAEPTEPIDWKNKMSGWTDDEINDYICNYDDSRDRIIGTKVSSDDFCIYSGSQMIDFIQKYYPNTDPVMACALNRVTPLVYNKKGIDVFTLTRENETGDRFTIWGVRFELNNISTDTRPESEGGEGDKWKDNKYGYVEKIAELSFVEVTETESQDGEKVNKKYLKPEITFFEKGKVVQEKHFNCDYLSIHQGLLDKVYEVKKNLSVKEKQLITKALYEYFVESNCDKEVMDYLPGLTIHSGRSKPNNDDMPQHQPFIQYSAIENAVSDCKYTLVELLDFACYEQ